MFFNKFEIEFPFFVLHSFINFSIKSFVQKYGTTFVSIHKLFNVLMLFNIAFLKFTSIFVFFLIFIESSLILLLLLFLEVE
jgi:hypothetical protein